MLRPLGIRIPVYPLKGYSVTLPLGPAEAARAAARALADIVSGRRPEVMFRFQS
jgi:hypothetical protein